MPLISLCELQEMSATLIAGNDAVAGHIISTTIGGKNGEPKQVGIDNLLCLFVAFNLTQNLFIFIAQD